MNSRERVLTAIEHQKPDRVPLDCQYCFQPEIWSELKAHYNCSEDTILKKFGIDFRNVGMRNTKEQEMLKEFPKMLPDGTFKDTYGIRRRWSTTLSGMSRHWVIVSHPLENVESLDEYKFPEIPDPSARDLSDTARRIRKVQKDGYAAKFRYFEYFFELPWQLRGFNKFIVDMYINEKFVDELLNKQLERWLQRAKVLDELRPDIIWHGDDVGTQVGMMIRPDLWRKFIKPRFKKAIEDAKKRCGAYMLYHTDGNVEPIIPELIEIGVDILNPVQPDCMDPAKIKRLYGDKLTLHGTISVQETLPFGTVEEIKSVVKNRVETCGYDGGLILAPSHTVEPPTPVENVVALFETAQNYSLSFVQKS